MQAYNMPNRFLQNNPGRAKFTKYANIIFL